MEYAKAARIRQTGLLKLITEKKFEEGQGLGSSIGGAISEKFKAKAVGIKESLDPLNLISKLTGKGTFGKVITTLAGRAFGRSEKDISYFGGFKRRTSNKHPQFTTETPGPEKALRSGDSVANILGKMYNFMRKSAADRKRQQEIDHSFRQEQLDEDERRHQQLVRAITGKKGKPTAAPAKERGDSLLDIVTSMINSLKQWIENFKETIKPILEFVGEMMKSLARFGIQSFLKLLGLLGNPMFLALAVGAASIFALRELLFKVAEVTPDFTKLTPAEARAALTSEQEIVKQAQQRYKTQNVTEEQIKETKEYLQKRVKEGRAEAEKIQAMPEGPEKEKAIREFGGKQTFEKTLADKTVLDLPTDSEIQKFPEKVPPRPKTGGLALKSKQQKWDNDWGKTHDPETGIRKDLLKTVTPQPAAGTPGTPGAAGTPGAPGASATPAQTVSKVPEKVDIEGAKVGIMSTPAYTQNLSVATPVPRSIPDIPPVPEPMMVSQAQSEPVIQVNNNTKTIGGTKDKFVTTSTPKQRNSDLDRYLVSSSVIV